MVVYVGPSGLLPRQTPQHPGPPPPDTGIACVGETENRGVPLRGSIRVPLKGSIRVL